MGIATNNPCAVEMPIKQENGDMTTAASVCLMGAPTIGSGNDKNKSK